MVFLRTGVSVDVDVDADVDVFTDELLLLLSLGGCRVGVVLMGGAHGPRGV